ncbi:GGDEF domain-containing protein [bacterium]|nr:GGDEF domain-containing protein [bacterium]
MTYQEEYFLFFLDQKLTLEPKMSYTIGRNADCSVVFPNKEVSRNHAVLEWQNQFFIIRDLNSTNGTFVDSKKIEKQRLYDGNKIRIGEYFLEFRAIDTSKTPADLGLSDTMILEKNIAQIIDKVEDPSIVRKISDLKSSFMEQKEKLTDLAYRDKLTKLYNRGYFDNRLKEEWVRAKRYKRNLSLIMIDIDFFKKFNDTYGHQKGDEVLSTVAAILQNSIRFNDLAARYGGEEMVAVLPETDLEKATIVAEKIRRNVQELVKKEAGVETTISLGVACYSVKNDSPEKILKAADDALYRAKEGGRNRVEPSPHT